jgi:hypothetical protein
MVTPVIQVTGVNEETWVGKHALKYVKQIHGNLGLKKRKYFS